MATHHTTHVETPHHVPETPHPKAPHPEEPRPVEPRPKEPEVKEPQPREREPREPREGGGPGGGLGVQTEALSTMEGNLGKTRDKVESVGRTVEGAGFGGQSMGALGVVMTDDLNKTIAGAKEHVARTTKAVDEAGARTKAAREGYQNTEAAATDEINSAGRAEAKTPAGGDTTTPSSATGDSGGKGPNPPNDGGGPPPPPNDPPGGGMHNNQGNFASEADLEGQYPRDVMRTRPTSTDDQIRGAAARLGYDPDQHLALTLKPTASMTPAERAEIVAVRNELHANPGEIMTKVVKPEIGEATLQNQTTYLNAHDNTTQPNYPNSVAGSIARGSDTAQYGTPMEFRDKLALDDQGEGWTPIKANANEAYQLRFLASDDPTAMEISYGGTDKVSAHDMQVASGQANPREWKPPFLGTGYTGGGVPEWLHAPRGYAGRGEMWLVRADGTEVLAGVYLPNKGWFDVRGRGGSGGSP